MSKSMTVQELAKRIVNQERTFILDVRNKDEFEKWKIEGKTIEVVNMPYYNLLDSVEPVSDYTDKDREIIVACAKGGSSQMVADLLEDAGFTNVYSLEGGMKAWSEHLEPVKIGDLQDGGTLYQFVRLGKGCLSYFIESNGEAVVVDAARMTGVYEQFAKKLGVKIKYVIDTHLHADHISGGRHLAKQAGAAYYLPPKDATEVTFDFTPVEEGSDITVGDTTVDVQPIYSPGHTIGSTSFIVDETYLLSGDTLFVESIGRPDLAGLAEDWVDDLRETLYHRYRNLSKDLIVLPAHYSFAKEMGDGGKIFARLGALYSENSGLRIGDEKEFRKMVTENLPPQPNEHETIRKTNMGKINPDQEKQKEMEIGPNRCAVAR
ncbi:MBL fold metallo-hydrolase [Virgibacillus siamensis]|uniref:MBL fold metallo-hydrolase n=1 Tax=Virgibacillus siamensis TaxID=480071 RepID=UPI00098631D7|nr:MBL fold metallo-hydrolase [Virgibacillus siamensis]